MTSRLALSALAILGSAVTADAQTTSAWAFQCPSAGTSLETSVGSSIRFRGQSSEGGAVCLTVQGSRFLGLFPTTDGFYRAAGDRLNRLVSGGLDLRDVRPVTFQYFGINSFQDSISINERWTVSDGGRIATAAGSFSTVRVERQFEVVGSSWRYTQNVWLDRDTNMPVRVEFQHVNPLWPATHQDWTAVGIQHRHLAGR